MIKFFRQLIFSLRFRRAVRKADYLHKISHRKYMVLVINRRLEVISKQDIRKFVANGIFRRGTSVADIEQKALYVTL